MVAARGRLGDSTSDARKAAGKAARTAAGRLSAGASTAAGAVAASSAASAVASAASSAVSAVAAGAAAVTASPAASAVAAAASTAASAVVGTASTAASAVIVTVAGVPERLPPGVRDHVSQSAKRLAKVRSPSGAKRAMIEEAERLFIAGTPLLVAAPLPVRGWTARLAAGTVGGAAAVAEQAEELAAAVSWGGALPSAPVVAGAVITGWMVELWVAVSARVNQLKAAGRDVDPVLLSRELAGAYLGNAGAVSGEGAARAARAVAVRAAEQWAIGLVPGVGIAVDAFSSQRTVARILRQPVEGHPPVSGPWRPAARRLDQRRRTASPRRRLSYRRRHPPLFEPVPRASPRHRARPQ